MRVIAMVPARLGSQRLKKKNLADLHGAPLVAHAIRKCRRAECFDEIWLNSESEEFRSICDQEGAQFHHRPAALGGDNATSEDFVSEFLNAHECDYVVQVHSIAPLLTTRDVASFVNEVRRGSTDTLLSVVEENLECVYEGNPVNFTFSEKTNSQDLKPVRRIVWSISAWRRDVFLEAFQNEQCATYAGSIAYWPVNRLAGHVIKTQEDLDVARALFPLLGDTDAEV